MAKIGSQQLTFPNLLPTEARPHVSFRLWTFGRFVRWVGISYPIVWCRFFLLLAFGMRPPKKGLVSGRIPNAKQSYDPTRRWEKTILFVENTALRAEGSLREVQDFECLLACWPTSRLQDYIYLPRHHPLISLGSHFPEMNFTCRVNAMSSDQPGQLCLCNKV